MRDLLLLLLRFGGFLLFIFLEAFCFYLIVQFNQEQRAIFDNSWANASAAVSRATYKIDAFRKLGSANDSLAMVNARLLQELLAYKKLVAELQPDSLPLLDTTQRLIPAMVIRNSISNHNNFLVLDKGANDGVAKNMGVVLQNGIVGVVRSVGPRHALVMSIFHRQARPSASVRGTNYFGSLTWEERNVRELLLENVPKHATLALGDTIESSGYSLIFPQGIPIGTIDAVDDSDGGSDTYKIKVRLFADLGNLSRVYILDNPAREEQENLLQQVNNE
jgi:rod shape-determining protein MreC